MAADYRGCVARASCGSRTTVMRDRSFPSAPRSRTIGAMTTAAPPIQRFAALRLRGRTGPVDASVAWPLTAERPPALVVYFPDRGRFDDLPGTLARAANVVVLTANVRPAPDDVAATAFDDAAAVLGWAADHAAELDADPGRLVVAGAGAGAALAAGVALHARDEWWPAIVRQVLLDPDLDAWPASVPYASTLRVAQLDGAAPATIAGDGLLAARLRAAGVDVEELGDSDLLAGLARTLRRA
jgi:alpha/beta hydrolase fold